MIAAKRECLSNADLHVLKASGSAEELSQSRELGVKRLRQGISIVEKGQHVAKRVGDTSRKFAEIGQHCIAT